MSVTTDLETQAYRPDVAGQEFQWPSSLGLWMVAIYIGLFLVRPWEELMPWLQTLPVERIYAIVMLGAVILTGRGLRVTSQSVTVILFAAAVGLSALRAWQDVYAWPVFYQYATVIVTYFVIVAACRRLTDVNWLVVAYITTMYVYLAKSLWEYFVHDRHEFAQEVSRLVGIERTYGEPNSVAMSAVLSLPLWYYLWRSRRQLTGDVAILWQRIFGLVLLTYPCVALIAVGLTNSRAGMVGFAAFVGLSIWYAQREVLPVRTALLASLVLLVLWLVAPTEQKDRLRTLWNPAAGPANASASAGGRWEGFVAALQMLRDRPATGVGVGNFLPYRVAYVDGIGLVAHNLPGQILGETGWFGGICFAALVWAAWRNTQRLRVMSGAFLELEIYQQLAIALQITLLLSLLFGLSLHNGLRYNWLWIAAFGSLACEFCHLESRQFDQRVDMDEGMRAQL